MEEMAKVLVGSMAFAPMILCSLGVLLKGTPKVRSWTIPWILTAIGLGLGLATTFQKGGPIGEWLMNGSMQGLVASAMSQWYYQMWKQAAVDRKKP